MKEELAIKADKFNRDEIKKYSPDLEFLYELSLNAGIRLAKENDADENIIKCVEEHHGVEKFFSIESEVVANADCYKFIHPKGVLYYLSMLGRTFHDFNKELEQLNFKLNEKHNAVTLPSVKEELEPYYEFSQKLINEAKK